MGFICDFGEEDVSLCILFVKNYDVFIGEVDCVCSVEVRNCKIVSLNDFFL